ncbi:SHOCT domain-containing protein [Dellaglioa sp. L3N]
MAIGDTSISSVVEYKIKLGFSSIKNNFIIAETTGKSEWILGSAIKSLIDKFYIISFESDGLLFIGLTKLYKFSGNDMFISLNDFTNIDLKKSRLINGRLVFNAQKMTISMKNEKNREFLVYTYIISIPWLKENIKQSKILLSTYIGKSTTKKSELNLVLHSIMTNQPTSNIQDDIRSYKSLLDDGIISEEEFNAKKKEPLNL